MSWEAKHGFLQGQIQDDKELLKATLVTAKYSHGMYINQIISNHMASCVFTFPNFQVSMDII